MKALRILSIQQWLKNGLILIPALFAVSEWNQWLAIELTLAVVGFSLLTSAVYINNDLHDLEMDRQHPVKKNRVIASGQVSPSNARIIASMTFALGVVLLLLTKWQVAAAGMAYVLLNLLYTAYGKTIPVVDLVFISVGYIIRLVIGSFVAFAPLSPWVIIFVCLLAVYLVLLKRYGDVKLYREKGVLVRKTVQFYAKLNLHVIAMVFIHLIIAVYVLYIYFVFGALENEFSYLAYFTAPLAYFALYRYNKNALREAQKDPINILLSDYLSVGLLIVSFVILIVALYV